MYPLTCHAGFNVPAKAGKFDIVGFTVSGNDALASNVPIEFAIIDDNTIKVDDKMGKLIASLDPPTVVKHIIVNKKVTFDTSGTHDHFIEWFPSEPVKTRYGISLYFNNIKQGSVCLYVK